ncbi:MAG: hypothetical protein QOD73_2362, partial [Solirubrobacteraceae bacterium]|nr:hypothetical protein [Solirubrobacteraceae bacterium]
TPITGPHTDLVTVNGIFRPFVLADGRVAGTWRLQRGEVDIEPFDDRDPAALAAEAADVLRYLGVSTRRA